MIRTIPDVIRDRGSRYAVSGAPCGSVEEAKALLRELCKDKRFAKATHNSWGLILPSGPVKSDDGEAGAGMVILRMLEGRGVTGTWVCVTRWFGGVELGGDRFRHVQEAVRVWLG